jgi:hypothetical protein
VTLEKLVIESVWLLHGNVAFARAGRTETGPKAGLDMTFVGSVRSTDARRQTVPPPELLRLRMKL